MLLHGSLALDEEGLKSGGDTNQEIVSLLVNLTGIFEDDVGDVGHVIELSLSFLVSDVDLPLPGPSEKYL